MKSIILLVFLTFSLACSEQLDSAYLEELEAWKVEREQKLLAPDGYLSLEGLFWLEMGENRYGSGAQVLFPEELPAYMGTYVVKQDSVFHLKGSVPSIAYPYTADSIPVQRSGTYSWYIIERAARFAIRLKNTDSEARRSFKPLDYFPVATEWNKAAIFHPFEEPKTIQIENIAGFMSPSRSIGQLEFTMESTSYTLDVLEEDDQLFIIFGDKTNGEETYGGGRYLKTNRPDVDGRVSLDFNKAYNPPCVFTEFATCPLPPPQNVLEVAVRAGEKLVN